MGRRQKLFGYKLNPDFVSEVKHIANPTDVILGTCRSGDRSAMAVTILAKDGFTNAYTITDGVEGDLIKDSNSPYFGERMKNGME